MPTVYAALDDALLVVRGDPGDRTADRTLDDHDLDCLAVAPGAGENGDRVFCGTFDAGLWRSEDGADSWERVGEGTVGNKVMSVAVNPDDPDEVWAGTEPSAVYRSTDGGEAWTVREGLTDLPSASSWSFPPRPYTHHVRWIEVDPADPAHLYVSIEAGALVQTFDRGETWEDRMPDSRRDNHSLTTHPEAPGLAWAAAGDGYAETVDGGATWSHPQEGLDHRYCWSVAVDAEDSRTVLVSAARGARSAHNPASAESYVYRKRGDEPWERCDADLPAGEGMVRAVLARGDDGGEFYAATNRGLFETADAGETWEAFDVEWPAAFEEQTPSGLRVVF
ncbi:WD40/YVTN/BNR-like repeat-containing protein [Halegenticoccus soli]|uniref:WD40/YVTN/BNR-like repeat-containing protein n=1 Tax=Halegenticoccus soli TaxID=1985678 RepID=UPI000C6DD4CC|nr:hypothetical protein [Halegenticoccus soli]